MALLPLMGPWHLRYPRWNVETVRATLAALAPRRIATTALEPGAFDDPAWQDTPELALPHTVVPWARSAGIEVHAVGVPVPDPEAQADFARYAGQYPALRSAWGEVEAELDGVAERLGAPLTLERIREEVLPVLARHAAARERTFEDGPATGWLRERMETAADRVHALALELDPGAALAVLAPVDELPFLREALESRIEHATLVDPEPAPPHEAERERALLDYAMRVDEGDAERLLAQLGELEAAEARYHEANLLLAHRHPAEALERLETLLRGDFREPYWLPGFALARLGQLYDLAGRRDAALRSYRGVLAFDWAPEEARAAAAEGLERPFGAADDPEDAGGAGDGAPPYA